MTADNDRPEYVADVDAGRFALTLESADKVHILAGDDRPGAAAPEPVAINGVRYIVRATLRRETAAAEEYDIRTAAQPSNGSNILQPTRAQLGPVAEGWGIPWGETTYALRREGWTGDPTPAAIEQFRGAILAQLAEWLNRPDMLDALAEADRRARARFAADMGRAAAALESTAAQIRDTGEAILAGAPLALGSMLANELTGDGRTYLIDGLRAELEARR